MVTHWSASPAETESIGAKFAETLTGPVCIALHGDLGAGKTRLVRGLVAGWQGDVSQVSSPTYVLLNRYQTPRGPVSHLDAYRLGGIEDFESIGFDELLDEPASMVIVEWPERIAQLLPTKRLDIFISISSPDGRQIVVDSNSYKNPQVT